MKLVDAYADELEKLGVLQAAAWPAFTGLLRVGGAALRAMKTKGFKRGLQSFGGAAKRRFTTKAGAKTLGRETAQVLKDSVKDAAIITGGMSVGSAVGRGLGSGNPQGNYRAY